MMRCWIVSLVLVPVLGHAITPEEVRQIDDQATAASKAKDQRVSPGNVEQMLPPATPPRATKYASSSATSAPTAVHPNSSPAHRFAAEPHHDATAVQGDARGARDDTPEGLSVTGATIQNRRYFGIPLGTWFRVSLTRNITNAETSQVELTVDEDVPGKFHALPVGTILFANKGYNAATKRLDCAVVRGITPRGVEFTLRASCYDLQRLAGLNGVVSVNEQAVVKKGITTGVINTLRTAAEQSMTGSTSPLLAGVSGATDSVLNDHTQIANQTSEPSYTIYVSPQELLIRLDDTL